MIHHLKDLDLGITDFKYHHDRTQLVKLYHLKAQTLKYVEVIKASNKPVQVTSLESY